MDKDIDMHIRVRASVRTKLKVMAARRGLTLGQLLKEFVS